MYYAYAQGSARPVPSVWGKRNMKNSMASKSSQVVRLVLMCATTPLYCSSKHGHPMGSEDYQLNDHEPKCFYMKHR